MHEHVRKMNLGRLFAFLMALTVLLAPLSIAEASSTMVSHEEVMDQGGHCASMRDHSTAHHGVAGRTCCASTSIAVANAPPAVVAGEPVRTAPAVALLASFQLGFLEETATPPPRRS